MLYEAISRVTANQIASSNKAPIGRLCSPRNDIIITSLVTPLYKQLIVLFRPIRCRQNYHCPRNPRAASGGCNVQRVRHDARTATAKDAMGLDYYFVTREKFEELISTEALIEHEEIFGNYYGTPKSEIERTQQMSKRLLFDNRCKRRHLHS